MFARFDPQDVPEQFWCGPMRLSRWCATDVMALDPYEAIVAYEGPVLIVQGSADQIVDPSYARRAFEVYGRRKDACDSVELVMIEGAGHGFAPWHDRRAVAELLRFAKGMAS